MTFINTSEVGIRQTFGKEGGIFTADVLVKPGLRVFIPVLQSITPISTRIKQDTYRFETKTLDNVFTTLNINVQYRITEEDAKKAFFTLTDVRGQTKTYIEHVVRSQISEMTLDSAFSAQHEISERVYETLKDKMLSYGVTIVDTLVTEIEPDQEVKDAMNRINASARNKTAAQNEADATYIKKVRVAEADSERKRLTGVGMANMRKAIVEGYVNSISQASTDLKITPTEVMEFVQRIQELDVRESIGTSNNAKVLFIPNERERVVEQLHHVTESKD